jgi:predicted nucleic-acid-binding protein
MSEGFRVGPAPPCTQASRGEVEASVAIAGEEQERHGLGGPPAQEGPQAGRDRAPIALMLGLDTNVLVRFLVRDHEAQFERARRLIKREVGAQEKGLISLMVLLDTEWVLRSRYGLQKPHIIDAISGLLDATELEVEDEPAVEEALYLWKDSAAEFALLDRSSPRPTRMPGHGDLRCEGSQIDRLRGCVMRRGSAALRQIARSLWRSTTRACSH